MLSLTGKPVGDLAHFRFTFEFNYLFLPSSILEKSVIVPLFLDRGGWNQSVYIYKETVISHRTVGEMLYRGYIYFLEFLMFSFKTEIHPPTRHLNPRTRTQLPLYSHEKCCLNMWLI